MSLNKQTTERHEQATTHETTQHKTTRTTQDTKTLSDASASSAMGAKREDWKDRRTGRQVETYPVQAIHLIEMGTTNQQSGTQTTNRDNRQQQRHTAQTHTTPTSTASSPLHSSLVKEIQVDQLLVSL
jgi:hypothetical protein